MNIIERLKTWIADLWKRIRALGGGGSGEEPPEKPK